ncbi:SHOCT domain-containing protein [Chloroflexota bacterium]
MWFMHDFGVWGMLLGGIWMLVFWGGLIALIIWGITKLTRRDDSTIRHTPLEMAKERYARGEISKEQFEQIRKDLY